MREGRPAPPDGRERGLAMHPTRDIELTVTDIKQWAYCPRIPFYRYVLPVGHVRTYKVERGKTVQAVIEALERRRRLREYGLGRGERRVGVSVHSEKVHLAGK